MVLEESHIAHLVMGTPSLMGIRHFLLLAQKSYVSNTQLAQSDIDNAYWESLTEGVPDAVKQAKQRVQEHRGMRGSFHFNIDKGAECLLD